MNVLVTGKNGFIGQHVIYWLGVMNHVAVESVRDKPDAMIALAWSGLPNYESPAHYENVARQASDIRTAYHEGVDNITVIGTCLETVPNPPHYAKAKLALFSLLSDLPIKWVRLFYLYGPGQREDALLPSLRLAVARGDKQFSVIDGERDFMNVKEAAFWLCLVAKQTSVTGVIDCCTGIAEPVTDFCRRMLRPVDSIELVPDYPIPSYEPRSFHGNPEKLRSMR